MERNRQVTHVPLGTSRNFPSGSFLSQGYIWTLHSAHHYLNWGLWVWHSQSFLDCDIRCRYICQELHLPLVGGESRSLLMKSREIEVDTKKGKETRERERIDQICVSWRFYCYLPKSIVIGVGEGWNWEKMSMYYNVKQTPSVELCYPFPPWVRLRLEHCMRPMECR